MSTFTFTGAVLKMPPWQQIPSLVLCSPAKSERDCAEKIGAHSEDDLGQGYADESPVKDKFCCKIFRKSCLQCLQ